jgi:hypothetical protein
MQYSAECSVGRLMQGGTFTPRAANNPRTRSRNSVNGVAHSGPAHKCSTHSESPTKPPSPQTSLGMFFGIMARMGHPKD